GLAVPAKATDGALSPSMTAQPAPNSGPAPAPSPAPDQPEGVALTSPVAAESSSRGDSLASRPWFWIALAAVVVGTGVGAYFAFGRDPTNIPRSDLGNYRF